jgi:hypothetical protein
MANLWGKIFIAQLTENKTWIHNKKIFKKLILLNQGKGAKLLNELLCKVVRKDFESSIS